MKRTTTLFGLVIAAMGIGCGSTPCKALELANAAYRLVVECEKDNVKITLDDKRMGCRIAEGTYLYRATKEDGKKETYRGLKGVCVNVDGDRLTIRGKLAGLDIEHSFDLPKNRPIMEERIVVHNRTELTVALSDFEACFTRSITDDAGKILPEVAGDRFVAIPFRAKPDEGNPNYNDFSISDLIDKKGYEIRVKFDQKHERVPADHRQSEGWAWTHGGNTLGIFKFDQENMQWSILGVAKAGGSAALCFGGARMIDGEPSDLGRMKPGQTVRLGLTRYETNPGGYESAMIAFRNLLDENGCRFPKGFNPPVHWEQLYDMEGAWDDRLHKYTKAIVEKEAKKGVEYSCESLYLDPGWDTGFATTLWGEQWLGPRKKFVEKIQSKYGLKVSLHTPLAPWMSYNWPMGPNIGPSTYPPEARRSPNPPNATAGITTICLGSKAYLDEVAKRLLENCADGVAYLMYDGNWYQGGCNDPAHGHPVPFTKEDHMRVNVDLARRIHEKHPKVLIEMHDMIAGGSNSRNTPVYYKYGLPGSYDENWGFELMWNPIEDIASGRARSLYYYNLGCNVPIYLHIDLRKDKPGCPVLWWYASTCRHLGIGGTHTDPKIVEAQKAAMRYYRQFERFFKRGDFYGVGEEIHLHVLPEEQAFVVNVFNLTDQARIVSGDFDLRRAGLDGALQYKSSQPWSAVENGVLRVSLDMPPWSARVADVHIAP